MEVLAPEVHLGEAVVEQLLSLVASVEAATGRPALSDQSRLALQHAGSQPDGCVAVVPVHLDDEVIAFGQLSPSSGGWTLDVVSPAEPPLPDAVLDELVRNTLDAAPDAADSTSRVTWWRDGAATGELEAELGFTLDRELLQMRRSLAHRPARHDRHPVVRARTRRSVVPHRQQPGVRLAPRTE